MLTTAAALATDGNIVSGWITSGVLLMLTTVNARYLVEREEADVIELRSLAAAGGYTTLCALTFRDTFKAGASYYGVSDLEALAQDTHKFESRYLDRLVGPTLNVTSTGSAHPFISRIASTAQ